MNKNKSSLGRLGQTLFFLALMVTCLPVTECPAQENEGLEQYLQVALEQNNEIRAARARWEESAARERQAGTLPDPRIGAEYFLQPVETRTGPQEASLSLSQSFPWFGKLSLDKKMKQQESTIVAALLADTQLSVARKVKEAYIEYGYLKQAENTTGQIIELMTFLEKVAQTKYSSGNASYGDVLKIQIELATLQDKTSSIKDNAAPVRVKLNGLMGVEPDLALSQPNRLPAIELSIREEELMEMAIQYSPKILAGQNKISRNRTGLDMADRDFYPDFTVSVKTIFTGAAEFGSPPDSGRDPVIAGLSINLPIFRDRRLGAVAEKQAAISTARSELEQTEKNLEAEIELALFRYRDAERRLRLYRDNLIPKIRQQFEISLEAFQAGQFSIQELIDAEKNWFSFELSELRARADMAIEVSRLEELTGAALADWSKEDNPPKI